MTTLSLIMSELISALVHNIFKNKSQTCLYNDTLYLEHFETLIMPRFEILFVWSVALLYFVPHVSKVDNPLSPHTQLDQLLDYNRYMLNIKYISNIIVYDCRVYSLAGFASLRIEIYNIKKQYNSREAINKKEPKTFYLLPPCNFSGYFGGV